MKKLFALITSILWLLSLSSCDIQKLIELTSEEITGETEKIESVQVEWQGREFGFASHEGAIQRDEYYRGNSLSTKKYKLYNDIYDAVVSGVSILDVSDYGLGGDDIELIYRIFISDNPALFYISRNCKYLYSSDSGIVTDILLSYTDGEVTDEFDASCKLVKIADREIIAEKIDELESCVNEILEDIPETASLIDKEKLIHDYIVDNTSYNKTDVSIYENSNTVPHIFDAYGALCEGEAVCEGYAKSFQLLCNEVGIMCIQVEGTGNSDEHMWNAVLLDKWYHVDVTWDDDAENDLPYYAYFNIPDEICLRDHKLAQDAYNSAPDCNGDSFTYFNYYCARVTSLNRSPEYYKRVADAIDREEMDYIIIYADGIEVTDTYLKEYFLDSDSYFMRYVDKEGYDITPKWEYIQMGDYYYIPLE